MSKNSKATKDVAIRGETLPREAMGVFDPKESAEGIDIRLGQIKILHQANLFELPDGEKTDAFEGIILDIYNVNAWWEESYDITGGGIPPQCFSMDGIKLDPMSEKPQSEKGFCASCPQNKFESEIRKDGSPGRGKACKNMKRVHVMMANGQFPKRLTVPPTSLKAINEYVSLLLDKGIPYPIVNTHFGLDEASNKDGIKYSGLVLEKIGFAANTREEAEAIKQKKKDFWGAMREQPVETSEYFQPESEPE